MVRGIRRSTFDVTPRCGRVVRRSLAFFTLAFLLLEAGCSSAPNYAETIGNKTEQVDQIMRQVDERIAVVENEDPLEEPHILQVGRDPSQVEYMDMSVAEVLYTAMTNSQVLRDLGATIIRAPESISTSYQRPLQETDPRFGMEAALSAFDAQLNASASYQDNHRLFNNRFFGGGTNNFFQNYYNQLIQLSKTSATGTQYSLRSITDYNANNAPGNIFPSAWQQQFEGQIRQPLLQGGGLSFNRIAGPGAIPGVYNGILIAKVNNDITAADFERKVRNYVSDVLNAYWDLYFAYRDLDTKQEAFDRSRKTWQAYQAKQSASVQSGTSEALAREQYYRFQSELQDAISGRAAQRTQDYNGASGGVFRGVNGVFLAERRLRLMIGIPISDVKLIRPSDEPEIAPVVFDWPTVIGEALKRRPELEQQRLLVKRRELELVAARNFLMPRLDAVGTYRVRGLGNALAGGSGYLSSAYGQLGTFNFQEWELGMEYSVPIGFRQGHAAVQNAEFQVSHARAVLKEQERQIIHDVGVQIAEASRAYEQCQTNQNRYLAANDALDALEASREAGLPVNLNQLLDIQRRLAEAQSHYYLSRLQYAIALKNVHFEKGSLLEYSEIAVNGLPNILNNSGSPLPGDDTPTPSQDEVPSTPEIEPVPEQNGDRTATGNSLDFISKPIQNPAVQTLPAFTSSE